MKRRKEKKVIDTDDHTQFFVTLSSPGPEMLHILLKVALGLHCGVVLSGALMGIGGLSLLWDLLSAMFCALCLILWRRFVSRHHRRIVTVLVVLMLLRWGLSWTLGAPAAAYAGALAGLLYLPPLMAVSVMVGPISHRAWLAMVSLMGMLAIGGSFRGTLAESVLTDWRIGFIFVGSFSLLSFYLRKWSDHHSRLVESFARAKQLKQAAQTDELTGLLNRRAGRKRLDRAVIKQRTMTVLLMDVDHFKSINDTHGHHIGDQALTSLAGILRRSLRRSDAIVRWGGEEFVAILLDVPPHQAAKIGEKIRKAVATETPRIVLPLTISIGMACREPGETVDDMLRHADNALYKAKKDGRNRLVQAPPRSKPAS